MTHDSGWKIRAVRKVFWVLFATSGLFAQEIPSNILRAMQWRLIGPFRGGRVTSVAGIPNQPDIYYIGTPGGGVWKTEDAGRIWKPIADEIPVASIGAVAVAPSDPRTVYVGTGEQTQGNGVYKSSDGGSHWVNIGLRETHVITGIIVDPGDPEAVLVAAAGDHFSGAERGVFKTSDGGKNWRRVLFKDNETAAVDLEVAADNPKILYAAFWHRAADPFNPSEEKPKEQDATIFKSTDEGSTWTGIEGKGLPTEPMGRVGLAIAPGTNGQRVYAIATQGLFRSDDSGASWHRSTTDPRIIGNSYFSRIFINPRNADQIYVAQTTMYRSTDGGRTFEGFSGAPSGDDVHVLWINPADSRYMILGVDQGAIVSVDGGSTWTSWYNQPTGQFYHVITDQSFPYNVYGAQQDSGTAGVPSRSDYGEITYRDWAPVGAFEFCYIAPDPLNPDYIYGGGWYGSVVRYDKRTGQVATLFVRTQKYRTAQMAPITFSPQDPHTVYIASQYVMKSTNGGTSFQEISPDLTEKPQAGKEKPNPRREVISTIAPSTVQTGVMWAGTGNGLIHLTKDLHSWQNVTIPGLPERTGITMIEASRHDPATAYAVLSVFQDLHPMIYRTHDYGQNWKSIVAGLPEDGTARVVREDPERKGLLYAGTTNGVYYSLDDGDHWQTLQLNLPITPVTDLDVHGDDLVASTFGRSLWILDDMRPIRQFDGKWNQQNAYLLAPASAVRTHWDLNQDTPLPPETPAGQNPPDGAIIYYFLKAAPQDIRLSIFDAQGDLVREYSTTPPAYDTAPPNVPSYWFAPPAVLSTQPGMNRFVWDLRYPAPKTLRYGYFDSHLDYIEYTLSDHAIPGETPRQQPQGPLVVPGTYSLVLTVDGKSYRQSLTITLDPRVHASQADLGSQLAIEKNISAQMAASFDGYDQVGALQAALGERQKSIGTNPGMKDAEEAIKSLEEEAAKFGEGTRKDPGFGPFNRELSRLASMIATSDEHPAAPLEAAVKQACQDLSKKLVDWRELNQKKIQPVDALLGKYQLASLPIAPTGGTSLTCEWEAVHSTAEARSGM